MVDFKCTVMNILIICKYKTIELQLSTIFLEDFEIRSLPAGDPRASWARIPR